METAAGRQKTRCGGFTLMELLVVISIIALLMAISLAAFNRARAQGRRMACLANLRSLTQCWTMYSLDNDDKLCSPHTDWDAPPRSHWVVDGPYIPGNDVGGTAQAIHDGVLWPYVANTLAMFNCPDDSSGRLRSYAMGISMNGYPPTAPKNGPLRCFRTWNGITLASQRMVFIDALSHLPWIDGPFSYDDADGRPNWRFSIRCAITARHARGCNLALADGHCEYWRFRDKRTIAMGECRHVSGSIGDMAENPDRLRVLEWIPARED